MAGTDRTRCARCGEGWYDKADRVGDICPDCWQIEQLDLAAAEAQRAADEAKAKAVERRDERRRDRERDAKPDPAKAGKVPVAA